jgi:hypothetical protein
MSAARLFFLASLVLVSVACPKKQEPGTPETAGEKTTSTRPEATSLSLNPGYIFQDDLSGATIFLIAEKEALTAEHIFDPSNSCTGCTSGRCIKVGNKCGSCCKHVGYDSISKKFDIAVCEIDLASTSYPVLASTSVSQDQAVTSMGYGDGSLGEKKFLVAGGAKFVAPLRSASGRPFLVGDSGGPVFVGSEVVGVASHVNLMPPALSYAALFSTETSHWIDDWRNASGVCPE